MDSQGLDCVGRLTTLLQESSYWRQKKSTKLSFTHNLLQILRSGCPVKGAQGVVEGRGSAAGTGARLPTDLASAPDSSSHVMQTEEKQFSRCVSFPQTSARGPHLHEGTPVQEIRSPHYMSILWYLCPQVKGFWKDQSQTIANLDLESAAVFVNSRSLKEGSLCSWSLGSTLNVTFWIF